MYEFSEKKRKLVDGLFILCIIYVVTAVPKIIGWHNVFHVFFERNYNAYISAMNIAAISSNVFTSMVTILIYLFIKRLRETEKTKKLYGALFWIAVVSTIYSYLILIAVSVIKRFYPGFADVLVNFNKTIYSVGNIFYYAALFLPVPFYIAILIKEKLDINWMIIGSLTSMYLLLMGYLVRGIRNYLHGGIHYMTDMWFNKKYPFFAVLADNRVLIEIRSYFLITGLFVLVIIYKKKFAAQKAKEEI